MPGRASLLDVSEEALERLARVEHLAVQSSRLIVVCRTSRAGKPFFKLTDGGGKPSLRHTLILPATMPTMADDSDLGGALPGHQVVRHSDTQPLQPNPSIRSGSSAPAIMVARQDARPHTGAVRRASLGTSGARAVPLPGGVARARASRLPPPNGTYALVPLTTSRSRSRCPA